MGRSRISGIRRRSRAATALARLALAPVLLAAAAAVGPAAAGEPGDEAAKEPLCCGIPPRDEVTADLVFGRWVVTRAGIGLPLRSGERIEFRRDGTLATSQGPCRFAVLRAELTVTCADKSQTGEVRFIDDTKLIWRLDGQEMMFVAPTD